MSGFLAECFTCTKTGQCSQTSVQKIVGGFCCPLYEQVPEPVVYARSRVMSQYGLVSAARALLMRPTEPDEESFTMHYDRPPAGTTYSQRKQQFEGVAFIDVRNLGVMVYKNPDHTPILDAGETLQVDRKAETIEKVLQFELANGIIVPDAAPTQSSPTGVAQMAQQPFNPMMPPPPPPNGAPQQMPMPPMPQQMPQQPQMVMPQAPFGMPPMPQQGMPQQQMPPQQPMMPPPPPVASPQQAAQDPSQQQAAPAAGGKKKRGSAAAPPPPPPPPAPQQQQAPQQGFQPQQTWAPPGVPQQVAPQQQMPFQMPGQMPAPQQQPVFQQPQQGAPVGVDFTPVLQQVDLVGKAVNALGAADQESLKQLTGILAEIRMLLYVQVAATHHIYMGQAHLAPSLSGKDVTDVSKFLGYMQQFIPR